MSIDDLRKQCYYKALDALVDLYPYGKYDVAVFDIDDTLIDSKSGKAIKPMVKLYNYMRKTDINVVCITARPPEYGEYTKEEFKKLGIPYPDKFYFVGNNPGKGERKFSIRKYIEELPEGFKIIINIGDDNSDFKGGVYKRAIRLPSYHRKN